MALSEPVKTQLINKAAAGEPMPTRVICDEIRIPVSAGVVTVEFLAGGNLVATYTIDRIVLGDCIELRGFSGTIPIEFGFS